MQPWRAKGTYFLQHLTSIKLLNSTVYFLTKAYQWRWVQMRKALNRQKVSTAIHFCRDPFLKGYFTKKMAFFTGWPSSQSKPVWLTSVEYKIRYIKNVFPPYYHSLRCCFWTHWLSLFDHVTYVNIIKIYFLVFHWRKKLMTEYTFLGELFL